MRKITIEFDEDVFDLLFLSITSIGQVGTKLITSQAMLDPEKRNHVLIDNSGGIVTSKVEE